MESVPLTGVSIIDGTRVTSVIDPDTGTRRVHGLGAVGEPILPYLDHRAENYFLSVALPPDTPPVFRVETSAPVLKSGRFPSTRVPWSALGAPDFDPFAGISVGEALTNGR
jgi:hypothetical protein